MATAHSPARRRREAYVNHVLTRVPRKRKQALNTEVSEIIKMVGKIVACTVCGGHHLPWMK